MTSGKLLGKPGKLPVTYGLLLKCNRSISREVAGTLGNTWESSKKFWFWLEGSVIVVGHDSAMAPPSNAIPHHTTLTRSLPTDKQILGLRSRRPATGVSRALRARRCPRSVPESVPENGGCPTECPTGCPWGPSGPGLRSVQKVSRERPRSVKKCPDTPGTLSGHFLDTPSDTPSDTPIFGDTLGDTPVAGRRDRNSGDFWGCM